RGTAANGTRRSCRVLAPRAEGLQRHAHARFSNRSVTLLSFTLNAGRRRTHKNSCATSSELFRHTHLASVLDTMMADTANWGRQRDSPRGGKRWLGIYHAD